MEVLKKNFAIIGIIIVVVLGATLYVLLSGNSNQGVETTEGGALVAQTGEEVAAQEDPDVLKLLLDMRAIKLDGRLFTMPAFRVLQDTGKEVIKEDTGRANPFAPAGADDLNAAGDTQAEMQQPAKNLTQPSRNFNQQKRIPVPSESDEMTE